MVNSNATHNLALTVSPNPVGDIPKVSYSVSNDGVYWFSITSISGVGGRGIELFYGRFKELS